MRAYTNYFALHLGIHTFYVSFPRTLHPMTQLGMGVAALNHDSKFVAAYDNGVPKTEYWTYALDDSLDLIAKLPALAARIYRNVHKPGKELPALDLDQDLVGNGPLSLPEMSPFDSADATSPFYLGNYANLLGYGDNEGMKEYLRLYIALHGDHEGTSQYFLFN
jgi:citrate synthase